MTTILEPSFETISNWTCQTLGSGKSCGQQTYWKSDGTYSLGLQYAGGGVRHNANDYARIKQTVNFNSDFTLRFDYRYSRCSSGSWDGQEKLRLRVLVDSDVIETISFGASATNVTDHDVVISGYSGNHDLKLELWMVSGWVEYLYAQCLYLDNLRIIGDSPHNNYYVKHQTGADNANSGVSWDTAWRDFGYGLQNCPDGKILHVASNSGDEYNGSFPITSGTGKKIYMVVEDVNTTTRGKCQVKAT